MARKERYGIRLLSDHLLAKWNIFLAMTFERQWILLTDFVGSFCIINTILSESLIFFGGVVLLIQSIAIFVALGLFFFNSFIYSFNKIFYT